MKWTGTILILAVIFSFVVAFSNVNQKQELNQFENMVNAAVVIYDDFGGGSGVFIDDNVILTAAHCLEGRGAGILKIELRDGTILKSSGFYIDEEEDIGFIFVDANEISIAKVSPSPMNLGDTVYLVGAPFNRFFAFSLTKGIVSHSDRDVSEWDWEDLLQVDATGGQGSSGGPLYNSEGYLVGMYVGHAMNGGVGVCLCENAKSILEAYQRCKDATHIERN